MKYLGGAKHCRLGIKQRPRVLALEEPKDHKQDKEDPRHSIRYGYKHSVLLLILTTNLGFS